MRHTKNIFSRPAKNRIGLLCDLCVSSEVLRAGGKNFGKSLALSIGVLITTNVALADPPPQGLNSLSDDPVRVELAADGMKSVLERAFVVDQIPPDRQAPERAVIALNALATGQLAPQERAARIQEIVAGISAVLPEMNDPDVLMTDASLLVQNGVDSDINSLEFFGETDADGIKARVRPAVETAVAMYDRAMKLTDAAQEDAESHIDNPNSPAIALWKAASDKYQTAAYTRWMLSYDNALVLDRADSHRKEIAQDGIDHLKQWDDPSSQVQTTVRMQMAKLYMVK